MVSVGRMVLFLTEESPAPFHRVRLWMLDRIVPVNDIHESVATCLVACYSLLIFHYMYKLNIA